MLRDLGYQHFQGYSCAPPLQHGFSMDSEDDRHFPAVGGIPPHHPRDSTSKEDCSCVEVGGNSDIFHELQITSLGSQMDTGVFKGAMKLKETTEQATRYGGFLEPEDR